MARTLTAGVVLRHPGSGVVEFLACGTPLPEWAVGLVGDHVLDGPPSAPSAVESHDPPPAAPAVTASGPPPRSGKGSSDAAWTTYAREHDVPVTDEMRRSEVIAMCEAAGVPTE